MSSVIILLGAPGAGKGTQAVRLSAECSVPHVSTGDLFRANLKEETELGLKAEEYMNAGKLVPDQLVIDMLFDRVSADDCGEGYVLDGFPRTLAQAEAYGGRVAVETELTVANLRVSEETIVRRTAGRLMCGGCTRIHHLEFDPPTTEGTCDSCGGELYQRDDDKPEVVRERLRVYEAESAPLVTYYERLNILRHVDGEKSPDAVFAELREVCPGRV